MVYTGLVTNIPRGYGFLSVRFDSRVCQRKINPRIEDRVNPSVYLYKMNFAPKRICLRISGSSN